MMTATRSNRLNIQSGDEFPTGPQTYYIPLKLIDRAEYNPRNPKKSRLDRDSKQGKHVQNLAANFQEMGQLVPVNVSRKKNGRFHLNDGHCRVATAELCEMTTIMAIVSDEKHKPESIYKAINGGVKLHSANENLMTFLSNSMATKDNRRVAYQNMVNHLGRRTVKKLAYGGYTIATYKQALKIGTYCSQTDKEFIIQVLNWLVNNRQTFPARKAMEGGINPARLVRAIANNDKLFIL